MVEIHLSDRLGHVSSKKLGFSWLHFVFGPFYCFYKLHFILGLLEALFVYYMTPIPGMKELLDLINMPDNVAKYFLVFKDIKEPNWIISLLILIVVHVLVSAYISGYFLKREMKKKQLRPIEEKDARLLIKYHVTNTNVALAESFDLRQSNSFKSAEEQWYESNQMRLKGERATKFMTRSTILFASDKTGYGKRKPGTQTIEIESWNDNSFGGFDQKKIEKSIGDDEFSNFTDYSKLIPKAKKSDEGEIKTEPIHFDSGKTVEFNRNDLNDSFSFTKSKSDESK